MLNHIILGIVQGLAEFLPVSSSGHLVLMQHFMGMSGEEVSLSVVLHLGTILAVLVFFWRQILLVFGDRREMFLIVLATIITGIIGILGKGFFERLFASPRMVAIALLINGGMLLSTRMIRASGGRLNLTPADSGIFGFIQAIAIIPGISRSGSTISALIWRGVDKQKSFRFSFLASIPAILGATLLEARDVFGGFSAAAGVYAAGFLASFFTGILALRLLQFMLRQAKFYYFGVYCLALGLITLVVIK